MSKIESAIQFAREHKEDYLNDFLSLVRIPSISTLPEHDQDMKQAAEWIATQLRSLGFDEVEILPTPRHPVVYGSWHQAGPDAPTILVYGHYDVQPVDPLDLWHSDPFEPEIREDNLFARGASDMKGQIVAHLKAMQAILEIDTLPINVKYMIEGEEEIGSPNLESFLNQHGDLFTCDFCLNIDSGMLGTDLPSLTYALRGLSYFELRLQGPATDLHSGTFGGAVVNPGNVLADLISGMKDENYRITLPGFYDNVRPLSEEEREELFKLPQPDEWWMEQSGAEVLDGERGYSSTERATARPTLDVNGLYSGFIGEGSKTVLPSKAMAKISMRLVPDQEPEQIKKSLETYIAQNIPAGISWELEDLSSAIPGIIDRDSDTIRAATVAIEKVWGKTPLFKREGGTIPVVGLIKELLGVNSLLLGFGLPDDNLHAPNEKMYLPNFFRGIETFIHFMYGTAGRENGNRSWTVEEALPNYGGQALVEGVMMRGQKVCAIAARAPDQTILIDRQPLNKIYSSWMAKVPFFRGLLMLGDALVLGMRALTFSVNVQADEDEQVEGLPMVLTLLFSLAAGIGLFFLLPTGIAYFFEINFGLEGIGISIVEGLVRLLLLIGYIWGIGFMPEIARVYGYHGAEHKTINAFEAGAPITVESISRFSREHPRCGTSFLLTVVGFSILIFSLLGPMPILLRLASRIILVPFLAMLSYEYIRLVAKFQNSSFIKAIISPNLALQRLTTREPDSEMIEVAIAAFEAMREDELALQRAVP